VRSIVNPQQRSQRLALSATHPPTQDLGVTGLNRCGITRPRTRVLERSDRREAIRPFTQNKPGSAEPGGDRPLRDAEAAGDVCDRHLMELEEQKNETYIAR